MNFSFATPIRVIKINFHYTLGERQCRDEHEHGQHQELVHNEGYGDQLAGALVETHFKVLKPCYNVINI